MEEVRTAKPGVPRDRARTGTRAVGRAARTLCVALACGAGSVTGASASGPESPALTGIVAEHVVRTGPGGRIVDLRRVETSAHGTRTLSMGMRDGEPYLGTNEWLVNARLQRLWLIDRDRRVVHRVPLSAGEPASGGPAAEPTHGKVFAPAPCGDLHPVEVGADTWRGREVVAFDCEDTLGRALSRESLDVDAGIVVRVVPGDGPVSEVRAIRARELGPERFLPDDSLREVGIREFLEGPAPLAEYVDG